MQNSTVEKAVHSILVAIGENPDRGGLLGTPRRVAEMYRELFSGMLQDPQDVLDDGFEEGHQEMVILRRIPFFSMCEHHLLPFSGVANVGYVPRGRVIGLSRVSQALDILARRPQLQERLTTQMVDAIMASLQPYGAAVVLEAEHLCMTLLGSQKAGSSVITSATRGVFRARGMTRAEFLTLVQGR